MSLIPVAGSALMLTLLAMVALYVAHHRQQVLARVSNELLTVTGLKGSQIKSWRLERLGDARTVQAMPGWGDFLRLAKTNAAEVTDHPLRGQLENLRRNYGYDAALVYCRDTGLVAQAGEAPGPRSISSATWERAEQASDPFDSELYREGNGRIVYDLVAPIRAEGALLGVVVLRGDARRMLFPLVAFWPLPQETAEAFLVRVDGEEVVALTDLQGRPDAALNFRLPRDQPRLAAVKALAEAPHGTASGLDYRGREVVAAVRAIEGTPWLLVAKIDRDEVAAHLQTEMIGIAVGGALVVVSGGLVLYGYVRRRTWKLEEERRLAEKQKAAAEARLGLLMSHANDAVLLMSEDGRVVEANDRALTIYGRSKEALIGLALEAIRAPSAAMTLEFDFTAAREGGTVFETRHVRSDGSEFPVEVSARAVELEGQRYVLSLVREITVRKAHEAEIERLSDLYQLLSHINQAIVRQKARSELFQEICDVLVRSGLFKLAWIGWHDQDTRAITPVAAAGEAAAYAHSIIVCSDPTVPEGKGPTGTAVRDGTVQVMNDIPSNPRFAAWRAMADKHGIKSSVCVPLIADGTSIGALSVYAGEADAFGPREVAVLQDAVRDIVFALDMLKTRDARTRAERALRESEKRLQHLLENTPAVIFSLEPHTFTTLYLSNNLRSLLGYSPEEFMANPGMWHECLHPDDIEVAWHGPDDLPSQDHFIRQYRMRHRAGHYVWLNEETRILRGPDGAVRELIGNWTDISVRIQDEEQLRKLSRAIEQNPASIVITDLLGAIEYVNPRFTELTGYDFEEVRGKNPRVLKSGLTDDAVYRSLWSTIKSGEVWRGEIINRKKSGEVFTEWVVITPVVDAAGRQTHYVAVKEDITQRKAVEERLRQLSRTIEQAPLSIAITNLKGDIDYVNPHFTEVTGYTAAEALGKNPRILKSGQTPEAVYREMWDTLTAGRVWRGELINRKKNGQCYVESAVIAPVVGTEGTITHYVALKEDITQRKAVEERLRQLSRTIEQAPLAVAITNLAGEIEYVNPRFTEVSGYSFDEAVGQNHRLLKSGDTPGQIYREMWTTLTSGGVWRGELTNRKKNGDVFVESAVIAPVLGANGEITHFVALKEDITERKKTEAVLRETQERFQMIAQNISDVVWLYDLAADRFVYVSPSAQRMFGRPGEAYLGLKVEEAWIAAREAATIRQVARSRMQEILADSEAQRVMQLESDQQHADGRQIPTEIVVTILDGADGRPARLLGVTRDISERKRAAAALEESERLYRMIADNTSDVTWVCEVASGRFTYVSPACERILGYAPADLVGRPMAAFLSETARRAVAETLPLRVKAFNEGDHSVRTRTQLFENLHARGHVVYGETVTTLLAGDDGRAARIIGVSRDVTQRKLAEDALLSSRDRLASAERMAHLGNWESRGPDRQQAWSDELFRIYEFEVTEDHVVPYEQFRSRVHPDDLGRIEEVFIAAVAQRQPVRMDHRLLFPDGRIKHVEVSGRVKCDESGNVLSVLGTVQDVTSRKEAEIALHELVKQLRAYHEVSVVLADRSRPVSDLLDVVATQLPSAMRDPEFAQVDVVFGEITVHAGHGGRRAVECREELHVGTKVGHITVGYVGRSSLVGPELKFHPEEREIVAGIARALGIALGERESFGQLMASEGRFRAIFDLAEVGMFESTLDGRITRANRFLGELLGFGAEELVGRMWSDFCPALADGGQLPPSKPLEVVCCRADGCEFWGAVSSNIESDGGKNAVGRIGLWRDITAEVEARETLLRFNAELEEKVAKRTAELAARNREVQALVQAIPDLVIQMREDGTILDLEPARGATRLSLIESDEERALKTALIEEALTIGRRALATQSIVALEKEIQPNLALDLRVAPSAQGSFVLLARDITVRKRLETETVRMLEQAKELASMKTRFISVTSHEFRTPMAAALGSVDLLQNHADRLSPTKKGELFERVRASLKRMTEMLDDVLTLNRLDAKKSEVKLVSVNLGHEVKGVIDEVRAGDQGAHEFVFITEAEVTNFQTDHAILHHILANFLSNAARYSPAGTTVTVRQRRLEGVVELVVEDHGIGIPLDDRARIWEPFERASNVGEIKGTGLGLNIVKRMAEQLHGSVALECPAEGGSHFIVRLPILPDPVSV